MKERVWHTQRAFADEQGRIVLPPDGGDEDALQVAQALANVCDAETLRSLLDLKVLLDRVGGEGYIGAYRIKVDPEGHQIPPEEMQDPNRPGTYLTMGYLFTYDPVAKKTRRATEAPEEPQADLRESYPLDLDGAGEEPEPEEQPEPELARS